MGIIGGVEGGRISIGLDVEGRYAGSIRGGLGQSSGSEEFIRSLPERYGQVRYRSAGPVVEADGQNSGGRGDAVRSPLTPGFEDGRKIGFGCDGFVHSGGI